jgi:predicted TIM-barrel fold metal-dependent hydrolase
MTCKLRFLSCVVLLLGLVAVGQQTPPLTQPGPMDRVLLKDYTPDSSLVVPSHFVPKAKYPVIDVHTHPAEQGKIKTPEGVAAWLKTMDEVGIVTSVVFTGATGSEFDRQVELYRPFAQRFQLYCSLDTTNITAPDYPQRAARELERCYRKGARGTGELSDKGWGMQRTEANAEPRLQRMHVDDPRLDLFWEKCAELKIPVNLHVADHPSCWTPLGPHQERTSFYQKFNLYGKDVPSFQEMIERRDRVLARHPRTIFIACHFGNQGHDMETLAKELDRYPNLYLDISGRAYEIGREPRTALKFLTRYKDRVVFGTDEGLRKPMYQGWWRLLETRDEFIPGRAWWRLYGLELPDAVLQALYSGTAKKVLNWQQW